MFRHLNPGRSPLRTLRRFALDQGGVTAVAEFDGRPAPVVIAAVAHDQAAAAHSAQLV